MIRFATDADIEPITVLVKRFHETSDYGKHLAYHPEKVAALIARSTSDESGAFVAVSEHEGAVVGFIIGYNYEHPYTGELIASELFWFTEPKFRRDGVKLFRCFEVWADMIGATRIHMIAPTEKVGRFYAKRGYDALETVYTKAL